MGNKYFSVCKRGHLRPADQIERGCLICKPPKWRQSMQKRAPTIGRSFEPDVRKKISETLCKRGLGIPNDCKQIYKKLRSSGFSREEALAFAHPKAGDGG